MFNLSTPSPLEKSKMASLVPLIPSQVPAVPHLREFRPFTPGIQYAASTHIHSHATTYSRYPAHTRHWARPLSEPVLWLGLVGPRGFMN